MKMGPVVGRRMFQAGVQRGHGLEVRMCGPDCREPAHRLRMQLRRKVRTSSSKEFQSQMKDFGHCIKGLGHH